LILAVALPQTPPGELTSLPRPPSWISGGLLLRAGRRREERGGEKGKRTGGKICHVPHPWREIDAYTRSVGLPECYVGDLTVCMWVA